MSVVSIDPISMVNHHKLPVATAPTCAFHYAVGRDVHRCPSVRLQIDAGVEGSLTRKRIASSSERTPQNAVYRPQAGLRVRLPLKRIAVIDVGVHRCPEKIELLNRGFDGGTKRRVQIDQLLMRRGDRRMNSVRGRNLTREVFQRGHLLAVLKRLMLQVLIPGTQMVK